MKTTGLNFSLAVLAVLSHSVLGTPVPTAGEKIDIWSVVAFAEPACTGLGTGWTAGVSHTCGALSPLKATTHDVLVRSGACTVTVWKTEDGACPAADAVRTFAPGTNGCFSFDVGVGNFEVAC